MIPISDEPGVRRRRAPIITTIIIIVNVLVFLYQLSLGSRALERFVFSAGVIPCEIRATCDVVDPIGGSTLFTLFTSMFMHGGLLHIGSNMLYLWIFGDNVEDNFGHLRFLIFYLVAGLAASFTHIAFNPSSEIPSIGASGAIAGVLAAYLVLYPGSRVRTLIFIGPLIVLPRISAIFLIGFWVFLQLISGLASLGVPTEQTGGVAVWAHIGGFVAGLVIVLFMKLFRD